MPPLFWNEQEHCLPQCVVSWLTWRNPAADLLIAGSFGVFPLQFPSLPDLIPALTAAEQRAAASLKWRTHEKLLQKYACLPHIISSDQIYYRFLQRMFTIMMTNVSPTLYLLLWDFWQVFHILETVQHPGHSILPEEGFFPGCFSTSLPLLIFYQWERSAQVTSFTLFAYRQGEGKQTHLSLDAVCLKERVRNQRPPLPVPLPALTNTFYVLWPQGLLQPYHFAKAPSVSLRLVWLLFKTSP